MEVSLGWQLVPINPGSVFLSGGLVGRAPAWKEGIRDPPLPAPTTSPCEWPGVRTSARGPPGLPTFKEPRWEGAQQGVNGGQGPTS